MSVFVARSRHKNAVELNRVGSLFGEASAERKTAPGPARCTRAPMMPVSALVLN
jgi:hypothetical protein